MTNRKTLILGGVKSGKSLLAENMAIATGLDVIYIATARVEDSEMQLRVDVHRNRRSEKWIVIEEPYALANALDEYSNSNQCVIVDCLTLWVTNLLMLKDESKYFMEKEFLINSLSNIKGKLIIVSNETNMGIIPTGSLSRFYCDEIGQLHQIIARCCDSVLITIAGLPMVLK